MIKPLESATGIGIRLIQFGLSGAGKSVRAADAVRWGRVEFHDFDGLAGNLLTYLKATKPHVLKNITFEDYIDEKGALAEPAEIIQKFFDRISAIGQAAEAGKPIVETVVVDSYSRFEDLYFSHLMSLYKSSGTGFGTARATIKETTSSEVVMPGTADHDLKNRALYKFFQSLKSMRTNVIINCHTQEDAKLEVVTIKASGQIRNSMPTEFNEWHYLFTDDYGKNRVQVRPAQGRLAKTALTGIPANGVVLTDSLSILDDRAIKNSDLAIVQSLDVTKTK